MNKHVSGSEVETPKVTTGPLPAPRKLYSRPEAAPDLRVPIREIMLDASSGEPPLPVYDTTGPYTDSDVAIDVEKGLSRRRIEWVKERGGVEEYDGRVPSRPRTTAMSPPSMRRAPSRPRIGRCAGSMAIP
jgi:phosphomethylpyrimidine synthase